MIYVHEDTQVAYFNLDIATETQTYEVFVQNKMQATISELALMHNFTKIETSYFYLFNEITNDTLFVLECDILDKCPTKIAVEYYLYKRNTNKFIAKAFCVYKK